MKKEVDYNIFTQPDNFILSKHTVVIGNGNNANLICDFFEKKKWHILKQNQIKFTRYQFKWVPHYEQIDYNLLVEGMQIANHISNIYIYTSKVGLIQTLLLYEVNNKNPQIQMSNFFPRAYILDITEPLLTKLEKQFLETQNGGLWISKPANLNCARGIQMVSDIHDFKQEFIKMKKNCEFIAKTRIFESKYFSKDNTLSVIQKYLENPLLINGKKFDIRCYVVIACTKPVLVLFHHGYCRLSINQYNIENCTDNNQRFTHFTNAFVQKTHKDYKQIKEDTIWSMMQFEQYAINNCGKKGTDLDELYLKIKQLLCYTIKAGLSQIDRKLGCFEIMGGDILIDDKFNPYLLELNTNPALDLDCQAQIDIIPYVVHSSLNCVLDIHKNCLQRNQVLQNIKENQNIQTFTVLINEATNYSLI